MSPAMAARASLAAALLAMAGCSDDPTAIRVKLAADPSLNSEEQVLRVIDQLQLVLDTPGGFAASIDEGLVHRNADMDAELELVHTQRIVDARAFPLLRLRSGGDHDRSLLLSARGLAGQQLAAIGDAVPTAFVTGDDREVTVPLDLRAQFRPPRVTATQPEHGQQGVPPALGAVLVMFSKWIAADSATGNVRLVYLSGAAPQTVAGAWELANTTVIEWGLPEERTIATFRLQDCALAPGDFRIEVSSAVTDVSGTPLDQRPLSPGADGFEATFTLPGAATGQPCGPSTGCTDDQACNPTSPARYLCVREGDAPGRCVPIPPSCDGGWSCPDGYRCDDTGDTIGCIMLPPHCDGRFICPAGYHCIESGSGGPVSCEKDPGCKTNPEGCGREAYCDEVLDRCVPCVTYPSPGCQIPCTEATHGNCPAGTYCRLTEHLCWSCDGPC